MPSTEIGQFPSLHAIREFAYFYLRDAWLAGLFERTLTRTPPAGQ